MPDYTVLTRQDVEQIARDICERDIREFLTEGEIIRLIDQQSAMRWHNVGLTVSPDSAVPGEPEKELRKRFDWMGEEYRRFVDSKGQVIRTLTALGSIATAVIVVVGGLWTLFAFVAPHIK